MLLTIAGVIAAIAVMNAVYPAVTRSSSALSSASGTVDDRIKTNISIVHSVGERDTGGSYADSCEANSDFDFCVWVKNVGDTRIPAIDQSDVFFGQPGAIRRIPHEDDAGGLYPRWSYTIENGPRWEVAKTVRFTITFDDSVCDGDDTCSTGTYFVRIITPNGVSSEAYFSM